MRPGIVSDEADFDLTRVLRDFVPEFGLGEIELRELKQDGRRIYLARDADLQMAREIGCQLADAGVRLTALDTPVFKVAWPGTQPLSFPADQHPPAATAADAGLEDQFELLRRAAGLAHELGTRRLRVFAFLRVARPRDILAPMMDALGRALEIAEKEDVELLLENEFATNMATGPETASILSALPHPRLSHLWDPGNSFAAGETPFPGAWQCLDPRRIAHIHVKDARRLPDGKVDWACMGAGVIDFAGQFRALRELNYNGSIALETHYRNPRNDRWNSSRESMYGLLRLLRPAQDGQGDMAE